MDNRFRIPLTIILIAFASTINSQNHPRVEEMHARKWAFIIEQVKLSPAEVAAVEPIFKEYEKAVWKIQQQFHLACKNAIKDKDAVAPNYVDLNERYVRLEMQKAQLLKKYNQQLTQQLSAEKIFFYFKSERRFKHQLIKDIKSRNASEVK